MRTHNTTRGWSPDRPLWASLAQISDGLDWRHVPFLSEVIHRVPDDRTGVYLICSQTAQSAVRELGVSTVLYVGSVTSPNRSLRKRFREHLKNPKPVLKKYRSCYHPVVSFWFTAVTASRAIQLEGLLKTVFNPPCNDINPPGTGLLLARIEAGVPLSASNRRHSA